MAETPMVHSIDKAQMREHLAAPLREIGRLTRKLPRVHPFSKTMVYQASRSEEAVWPK